MNLTKSLLMLLDPYDIQARLFPSLLMLFPFSILLINLLGEKRLLSSGFSVMLVTCGVGYLLGRVARNEGVKIQDKLFDKWGGSPTTQLLRHRNVQIDIHTKIRYHKKLSSALGMPMPSVEYELNNKAKADEIYKSATRYLIQYTRDTKKFPLVFKENVAYGFHRNALGLRVYGTIISIACLLITMVHSNIIDFGNSFHISAVSIENISPLNSISALSSLIMVVVWSLAISESSLKNAAFSYAERLLETCDEIA